MQKDIADNLGVTTQAIYKYEKGISYPDLSIIGLYAKLLKVDLDSFLHLKETNNYQDYDFNIDDFAFFGAEKIDTLTIQDKVESIGKYCFNGSKIKKITINSVVSIGQNAFEKCRDLELVVLPSNLECIANDTFINCEKLQNIYYLGTQEQWNQIDINDSSFDNLKIYYYSETDSGISDLYWHYMGDKPILW